jgi:hypothetical protein
MPVRHARSEMRGRPPFGRHGVVGKNGSTRSHNGSGSSAAAIPVHATSPARISFRRFCYVLLTTTLLRVRHRSAVGGGKRQSRAVVARQQRGRGSDGGAEPQARSGTGYFDSS